MDNINIQPVLVTEDDINNRISEIYQLRLEWGWALEEYQTELDGLIEQRNLLHV